MREPYDDGLFSAYAEVFPTAIMASAATTAFLCLRRGVSIEIQSDKKSFRLFSAYAEVFPVVSDALAALAAFLCLRRGVSIPARPFLVPGVTFLCLRRGVSLLCKVDDAMLDFSLPTQRCFLERVLPILKEHLFSAYAEVFPSLARP